MPYFWGHMSALHRQSDTCSRICQYLAIIAVLMMPAWTVAGEVAVDPTDNGVDLIQDSTLDLDSRSSETSAAAADLVDPAPLRVYMGPLADAVDDAEGHAEALTLLGTEIAPGTSQRLSWSATELFEGVPVSTPVLVANGIARELLPLPCRRRA
jgi:hypothetical protein